MCILYTFRHYELFIIAMHPGSPKRPCASAARWASRGGRTGPCSRWPRADSFHIYIYIYIYIWCIYIYIYIHSLRACMYIYIYIYM